MNSLKKFSVLDSRFKKFEEGRDEFIEKEIRLHRQLGPYYRDLQRLIDQYLDGLQQAKVPLPRVIRSEASEERLLYVCEYKGPNALEFFGEGGLALLLKDSELLDQILSILRKAQKARISFDPHIKNFVVNKKVVYYVDFTPPWLQEYYDIRYSVASQEEREILTSFYQCMDPDNLGYHFCSDFLKMNQSNLASMPSLYEILKCWELVRGPYDDFLVRCEQIKNSELRREQQGIYLL